MFPDRLQEIRTENDLTKTDAAALVGVVCSTWSTWEGGGKFPKPDYIRKIAKEFNVTPRWLETGLGEKYPEDEARVKAELEASKPKTSVVYSKENEEKLMDIVAIITNLKAMDVDLERKKHIHRTLSELRAELESKVIFGEER